MTRVNYKNLRSRYMANRKERLEIRKDAMRYMSSTRPLAFFCLLIFPVGLLWAFLRASYYYVEELVVMVLGLLHPSLAEKWLGPDPKLEESSQDKDLMTIEEPIRFRARISMVPTEHGGRSQPIRAGYRAFAGATLCIVSMDVPVLYPGEETKAVLECLPTVKDRKIFAPGIAFQTYEGTHHVLTGKVLEILNK